jgi:hypothetical protein
MLFLGTSKSGSRAIFPASLMDDSIGISIMRAAWIWNLPILNANVDRTEIWE